VLARMHASPAETLLEGLVAVADRAPLAAEKQTDLTPLKVGAAVVGGVLVLAAIHGHNAPPVRST
jgi:hypothetical protein